jgi:hypothetical protein
LDEVLVGWKPTLVGSEVRCSTRALIARPMSTSVACTPSKSRKHPLMLQTSCRGAQRAASIIMRLDMRHTARSSPTRRRARLRARVPLFVRTPGDGPGNDALVAEGAVPFTLTPDSTDSLASPFGSRIASDEGRRERLHERAPKLKTRCVGTSFFPRPS